MKRYTKCKKCGSNSFRYEERLAPVNHSFLDSLGRVLLLFIPIIGWAALLSRKNFIKETHAICKDCGYSKDLTTRTSLPAKYLLFLFIIYIIVVIIGAILLLR